MNFTKAHGLGNDFIILDFLRNGYPSPEGLPELASRLCDRHTGIGADGLVVVVPSGRADVGMRIFNPDGSEASMCGNAIRCLSRYVFENGLVGKTSFDVETGAGIMKPEILLDADGKVSAVRVNMGAPILERSRIPMKGHAGNVTDELLTFGTGTCKPGGYSSVRITSMLMGVPHTVIFTDDYPSLDPVRDGHTIESHPSFPEGTNVDFVHLENRHEIDVRTWERAAGATLACGTGSCASVVASVLNGRTERDVDVHLPLGTLKIDWNGEDVFMTGPAEKVFEGTF
ncbi:MAG: diaminopimelate epimerase [Bacteroidales bacterium]|jgi:diaminopimelate epimerase|nr:diaminopimelate epimerase [Bacteroidales bacterium]MCI2121910.1 diaminopimelate epimerase [Bacteroidales bacterium]MCI2146207.1 diaminopimelate epimerase [Bacteroidales bacterium]